MELKTPKPKKKWIIWVEPPCKAVRYVNEERRKMGAPVKLKDELALIEDSFATKELAKGASIVSPLDSYLDTQTFERRIVNANWAERVAKELKAWIDRPYPPEHPPIKITEFFREAGIYHRDFYRIAKQHEILQQALEYALQVLGDIRERYILENRFNSTAGMYMMGFYDEDWRKEIKRREDAKLKQAQASGTDIKAVVLDMLKPVSATAEVQAQVSQKKIEVKEDVSRE